MIERHRWHVAMGALAAGLASVPLVAEPPVALLLAVGAGALLALSARSRTRVLALAVLLALAGFVAGHARLREIDAPSALVRDGASLDVRAYALTHPRPGRFGSTVEVKVRGGRLDGARLFARVPRWVRWPRGLPIGGELRLVGTARRLGGSGFERHLRDRGLAGELQVDSARPTGRSRGGVIGVVDRLRRRAERAVAAGLPPHEAALERGMVLGQDEDIGEPTRDAFQASGLAHILAVSGQNVMLLVALALPLAAAAGLGPSGRAAVLLALIAVYVPLAGAGPSLQRAGVMGAAGIAAVAASRPASRAYALLLAAAVTLVLNPRAAADPGWQLSFAAVAGIIVLAGPLQRTLRAAGENLIHPGADRRAGRVARWSLHALADGASLTIAATAATAPLLANRFGAVPVAGLPANLLALPAVAPAMWLGMVKAALGQLDPALPGAGVAAAWLGGVTRLPVAYVDGLAELFARMPGGRVALPLSSAGSVTLAYAVLSAAALAVRHAARLASPHAQVAAAAWRRRPAPHRAAMVLLVAAGLALATVRVLAPPPWPRHVTVRFLDVGQGDATLIQHPDGTAVLFDAGPPEAHVATQLRRLGVRRLALLVATHPSRDHHGGIREVLQRFPVGLLLNGGDGTRDPTFRAAVAEARRRHVRTVPAIAPLALRAGGLSIRVLSPPPRAPGPPPEDPNPRGVVAIVSSGGFDLFLSADAESEALLPLVLPDVDAMKVPHHGSSDPGLPQVLARLRPEVAGIEVGEGNSYGHPAPSTLAALRAAHVTTYRTDRDGTVSVTAGAGRLAVETAP